MLAFRLLLVACGLAASAAAAQEGAKRVEREANNPLRLIIEAAKIRPKARPAEAAASAPPPTPRAARAASAPRPSEAPIEVLPSAPAGTARSAVATVEVEAEATPLQIRDQVEPVIPRELRSLIEGEVQVLVAFTVLSDGRVAEAAVLRSSHPEVNAAVLDAVRQWRYQPIAIATPHEVELVLRPGS